MTATKCPAPSTSLVLSLLIVSTISLLASADVLLPCADQINCGDRPTDSCASCLAPASFSSGFRCAVPKAILGLPALLDSNYCHYCESNGKCLGHKDVDATTCPGLEFQQFEEDCTGPPGDSGLATSDLSNDFLATWMGKVMEVSDGTNLTLYNLSIVGAHDALSYDLDTVYSTSASAELRSIVEEGSRTAALVVDEFTERALAFARRAAETQFLTVSQQLDSGVRFLDCRINYETDKKEWYSLHTMRSKQEIYVYLGEIRTWMVRHPKEIVVIWLSRAGSVDAKGTDQFPGASLEDKNTFWSTYAQIFDGMLLDNTATPPQSTPINDIAGKVLTFASDYEELTNSSVYALDAALYLKNILGGGIIGDVDDATGTSAIEHTYKFEQDEFSNYKTLKDTNSNIYHLLSMSSPVTAGWIGSAPLVELNPISTEKASSLLSCAALFDAIPDFGEEWCPMSLMDINLLTNYYKQITIEQVRTKEEWDFPQAIYIDGIDVNGTMRTSTHLPWNQPRSTYFENDDDENAIKRYGVVWAFLERNLRVACGGGNNDTTTTTTATEKCTEYLQIAQDGLTGYPDTRWDDPEFGRVTQWPEEHPFDIVLMPPPPKNEPGYNETDTSLSNKMHWMGGMGHGLWFLGLASSWLFCA